MPISMKVSIDFSQFKQALSQLGEKHFRAAGMIAVNDTARQANNLAVKLVAKESGLKSSDVRKRVRIIRASRSTLTAIVRGSGRALPLYTFNARQTKAGVSAKAWGKRKVYRGSFIATMRTGHVGVFTRTGDDRLPIKELFGPGVAGTMGRAEVRAQIEALIRERLPINVKRQMERRLRAISGKARLAAAAKSKLR
ncbi:phage tail protein [Dongia soli]|uniref:Phage tail protein n=1 Tax=Dongia soli TaxID=600628 RepID=A0ABU5E7Q1_9PROT|nr:phage tail protein [Dongia soli]MDY0882302.1 phage tail protein [Dongia soli]